MDALHAVLWPQALRRRGRGQADRRLFCVRRRRGGGRGQAAGGCIVVRKGRWKDAAVGWRPPMQWRSGGDLEDKRRVRRDGWQVRCEAGAGQSRPLLVCHVTWTRLSPGLRMVWRSRVYLKSSVSLA